MTLSRKAVDLSSHTHQIYLPDVGHVGLEFYILLNGRRAERSLSRLADQIQYYDRYLDQYPSVMVEHLEPLYRLARGLAAFDATFLSHQLNDAGGWRGIISGGLYCLLAGSTELVDQLRNVSVTRHPENMWSCECAVAYLTGSALPHEHQGIEAPLDIIRDAVLRLGVPAPPLRRGLTPDEIVEFEELRAKVRELYQEAGIGAAKDWMRSQSLYQWIVDYSEWATEFAVHSVCLSRYQPSNKA